MKLLPSPTFLRDEQGKTSLSRVLLLAQLLYVDLAVLAAVLFPAVTLTPEFWGYNGTLTIALVAWAAGPRGLQYLGPQIGATARGLTGRITGTDDPRKDDERA